MIYNIRLWDIWKVPVTPSFICHRFLLVLSVFFNITVKSWVVCYWSFYVCVCLMTTKLVHSWCRECCQNANVTKKTLARINLLYCGHAWWADPTISSSVNLKDSMFTVREELSFFRNPHTMKPRVCSYQFETQVDERFIQNIWGTSE